MTAWQLWCRSHRCFTQSTVVICSWEIPQKNWISGTEKHRLTPRHDEMKRLTSPQWYESCIWPSHKPLFFLCCLIWKCFHWEIPAHSKVAHVSSRSHVPSKHFNTVYLPKPCNPCEGNQAAQWRSSSFYITDTLNRRARITPYCCREEQSSLQSQINSAPVEICKASLQEAVWAEWARCQTVDSRRHLVEARNIVLCELTKKSVKIIARSFNHLWWKED